MSLKPQTITPGSNHTTVEQFWGFSVEEDAGATSFWRFRVAVAGGDVVWHLRLAANQSASIVFPESILTDGGCYVEEVSGSATGTLLHK